MTLSLEFNELKTNVSYVGKIIKREENVYEIVFLRKSLKSIDGFVFPLQDGVGLVSKKDVKN
mgnify:CR=1 FL=1